MFMAQNPFGKQKYLLNISYTVRLARTNIQPPAANANVILRRPTTCRIILRFQIPQKVGFLFFKKVSTLSRPQPSISASELPSQHHEVEFGLSEGRHAD
jgi:hypothetical protein